MDFRLTAEQEEYRKQVQQWVEEKVVPRAAEIDENDEYPWDLARGMAQLGWFGIPYPKQYSGKEEGMLTQCVILEEVARGSLAVSLILCVPWLSQVPYLMGATEAQKAKYLPALARGDKISCFALTEPGAGSDAAAIESLAVLENDRYVLNGRKRLAVHAGFADFNLIFAKTDNEKGDRVISLFVVEKGTPGLFAGKRDRKMGARGQVHGEIILQNCRVPRENLIGQVGQGLKLALQTLEGARIMAAAEAVGVARAAYEAAVQFAKERIAFGKPIAQHQAIQFMLADMAMELSAARLLTHTAAVLKDQGAYRIDKESAMAKLYASEAAHRIVDKAVQIHGGFGLTKEFAVERYYRDARVFEIFEGTSEIQRLVIGRQILKD